MLELAAVTAAASTPAETPSPLVALPPGTCIGRFRA
jgi:hypothetical protein